MSNDNQPAISKYIYVGNNKIVGPLDETFVIHSYKETGTIVDALYEIERKLFNAVVKCLPRIDVIGEHSFTEGQILGEGEDIKIEERWIRTEDDYYSNGHHKGSKTYKAIAVPIVHQPAISKEEVLSEYVWIEMPFPENKPEHGYYIIVGTNKDFQILSFFDGRDWLLEGDTIITNEVTHWLKRVPTASLREENTRLKAENAELRDALKWSHRGLDAAINHTKRIYKTQSIRSMVEGVSKPISSILSDAQSILSKHKP